MKFAHEISVQDGSYAFPNELVRFRIEAKPIWGNIQKQYKCSQNLDVALTF